MSQSRRDDPFAELLGGEFRERLRDDRWKPDVDVFETEKSIVVRAELAGVRGQDLRVTVDGQRTYAAAACVVQTAYNYGGIFELAPQAALDSGALNIMLIRARTNRDLFRILFSSWTRRLAHQKDVILLTGQHVRLEATRSVRLQADGDPAGSTDVEIELRPKSLTLLRA